MNFIKQVHCFIVVHMYLALLIMLLIAKIWIIWIIDDCLGFFSIKMLKKQNKKNPETKHAACKLAHILTPTHKLYGEVKGFSFSSIHLSCGAAGSPASRQI